LQPQPSKQTSPYSSPNRSSTTASIVSACSVHKVAFVNVT
jgi:hypothetical protein